MAARRPRTGRTVRRPALSVELLESRLAPSVAAGSRPPVPAPDLYPPPFAALPHGAEDLTGDRETAAAGQAAARAAFVPGQVLVGFDGEVPAAFRARGAAAALEAARRAVGDAGLADPVVLFDLPAAAGGGPRLVTRWSLPPGVDVAEAVARLSGRPGVAYAEPNGIMTAQFQPDDPSFTNPAGWPFGVQEHLGVAGNTARHVAATAAWDVPAAPDANLGAGVVVAVLDTGVDLDHPDLDGNLVPGANFVTANAAPQDDNGHGTHVAGIIAAEVNNLSDLAAQAGGSAAWKGGTVGVAPKAKIMPVKVLDAGGGGTWEAIAGGIKFAADNNADVISMSLGGGSSRAIHDAVEYAYGKGVVVISAAGNGYAEGSSSPASELHSLSVAAVDRNDVKADFSNYGFTVDVAAPGVDVLSTFIDANGNQTGSMTGAYGRISGTSMATPVVSGAAALILARNPSWTPEQVFSQLLATADNVDGAQDPRYAGKLGAGRVNALRAVTETVAGPKVIAVGGLGADGGTVGRLEVDQLIGVQFSHAMNAAAVLAPANYRLTLDGDGDPNADGNYFNDPGDSPVTGALALASTSYSAFPGQGVQLRLLTQLADGHYQFRVGAGVGVAADVTRTFTLRGAPLSTAVRLPLGAMVYQGGVNDRLTATVPAFILAGAGLDGPTGLVVQGNSLYAAGYNSDNVLRYDFGTGRLDTFVPVGSGGLDGADGLAFGPDGNLYVASRATNAVLRYNGATGAFIDAFVPAGSGGLGGPSGLAFGPDANGDGTPDLYVAGWGSNTVLRYSGATGAPLPSAGNTGATFIPAGTGGLSGPVDVAFGPDGKLYVASWDTDSVLRYDAATGAFLNTFVASGTGGLDSPTRLVFSGSYLYVSGHYSNSVVRYKLDGTLDGVEVPSGRGGLTYPVGLALRDGMTYVTSFGTDGVLRFGDPAPVPGDVDVFAVPLDTAIGQRVTVRVTSPIPNLPVALRHNGVNLGPLTDEDAGPGVLYQGVGPLTGGTLEVVVTAPDGLTTGAYRVQLTLNALLDHGNDNSPAQARPLGGSSVDADLTAGTFDRLAVLGTVQRPVAAITKETEPNNNSRLANDLRGSWVQTPAGSTTYTITGVTGSLNTTGDVFNTNYDRYDAFRVDLRAGDKVTVRSRARSSGGGTLTDARVYLYNDFLTIGGTPVAAGSSDHAITDYVIPADGRYTVEVGTGKKEKGTYSLDVTAVAAIDPRPDAADYYTFTAPAGPFTVAADTGVSDPRVQLDLFNAAGQLVATSTPRGTLDALLAATSPGAAYTVKVSPRADLKAEAVDYGLVVTLGGAFNAGGNQTAAAAAALPATGKVLGSLSAKGKSPAPAGIYYGYDVQGDQLFKVDPLTGLVERLATTGLNLSGLAFDPSKPGVIYGLDQANDRFYSLDRATGAATLIGRIGVDVSAGMDFVAKTGKIYAWKAGGTLVEINPATGKGRTVGPANPQEGAASGLASDDNPVSPTYGRLLGRINGPSRSFDINIDPADSIPDGTVTSTLPDRVWSYGFAHNGRQFITGTDSYIWWLDPDTGKSGLLVTLSEYTAMDALEYVGVGPTGTPYLDDPEAAYFTTAADGTLRLELPGAAAGEFVSTLTAVIEVQSGADWVAYGGQSLAAGTTFRVRATGGSGPFAVFSSAGAVGGGSGLAVTGGATSGGSSQPSEVDGLANPAGSGAGWSGSSLTTTAPVTPPTDEPLALFAAPELSGGTPFSGRTDCQEDAGDRRTAAGYPAPVRDEASAAPPAASGLTGGPDRPAEPGREGYEADPLADLGGVWLG